MHCQHGSLSLCSTHACVHPRRALGLGASRDGAPMAQRSYLGHVLPESLLHCLEMYGAEVRARARASVPLTLLPSPLVSWLQFEFQTHLVLCRAIEDAPGLLAPPSTQYTCCLLFLDCVTFSV